MGKRKKVIENSCMITLDFDYTLACPSNMTIIKKILHDHTHILHQCFSNRNLIHDDSYKNNITYNIDHISPYDIQSIIKFSDGHR